MTTIDVRHCGECPFHETWEVADGDIRERCALADCRIWWDEPERPEWCPLERGPVTVRLGNPMPEGGTRLCYVDGTVAYFTTLPLEKQCGDDWNDVPYECNAGTPYRHRDEAEPWEIWTVSFAPGRLKDPTSDARAGYVMSTTWSVDAINAGATQWLTTRGQYARPGETHVDIWAGVNLDLFRELVKRAGGACAEPELVE